MDERNEARGGLLHVHIEDVARLYRAYMPFVKNGGLFIPGERPHRLGDRLSLILHLPKIPEPQSVTGKVVWITPRHAQGNRRVGVGVQFLDDGEGSLRARIETLIGGLLKTDRPTDTF